MDNDTIATLVVGGFFLFAAVYMGARVYGRMRRATIYARKAPQMGMTFQASVPGDTFEGVPLSLFGRIRKPFIRNLLSRRDGPTTETIFEYEWRWRTNPINKPGGMSVPPGTVLLFECRDRVFPGLTIRPRSDALKALLPFPPVSFDEDPGFTALYDVFGTRIEAADPRELMTAQEDLFAEVQEKVGPDVRRILKQKPGLTVEAANRFLAIYQTGRIVPPADLPEFRRRAALLRDLLSKPA